MVRTHGAQECDVERKNATDWVSFCRSFAVEGYRLRGRGKKSWCECVKSDMKIKGLRADGPEIVRCGEVC